MNMQFTQSSVRLPSFWGPILLAGALLLVSNFSTPFWNNFYVLDAKSLNVTMKAGAWGICTGLRNSTNVPPPTTWCTGHYSGYTLNFAPNLTGINQFPTVQDDATLLGTNSDGAIPIIYPGSISSVAWLHVITTIVVWAALLTLVTPPKYLGNENAFLHRFQKGGGLPLLLAIAGAILAIITFAVNLSVGVAANNRLKVIDGITSKLGNTQWFVLPCAILIIVSLVSTLLSAPKNQYEDL